VTRILRTTQRLPKEPMQLERVTDVDQGGVTLYDSPVGFEANAVEYDVVARSRGSEFVEARDGTRYRVVATLYVQGDQTEVPELEDRVTRQDGRKMIVTDKKIVSGLLYTSSEPDFIRLGMRNE